jgi:CubicO group peptidase (beta-lactamase class C family)
MFVRSKKTRLLSAALLLSAASALAAPYADPKLVETWSRMDEFQAARGVRKAAEPRELKRAQPVPELERLLDDFLDAHRNTGLLILKGDKILAERYQYGRTAGHRFASASVAKTVLGMLVGIALSENHIKSLDDRADHYVPELKGHPYGDTSIRDLLTMSSGIRFTENYGGRDDASKLVANTLRQQTLGGADTVLEFKQREAPAGTRFRYASADSQVLGLVLIAAVKQPLADYLSEKLWQPMGAEANATWLLDKGGYETGYCCINATLRDYARFGMLLANYGALDGRQIIPAEWVRAATSAQAPHLRVGTATPNNGYGYQTWITHRTEPRFAALGIHGQAIYIDPLSKLVVVHTAAWSDPTDRAERGAQFKLLEAIFAKLEGQ